MCFSRRSWREEWESERRDETWRLFEREGEPEGPIPVAESEPDAEQEPGADREKVPAGTGS
jgi:hypothetical protein